MTYLRTAFLMAVLLALVPTRGAALDLQLHNVIIESGRFEFDRGDEEVLTEPPSVHGESRVALTGRYRVWIYPDDVEQSKYGYFKYKLYVRVKTDAAGPITLFTFQGNPVGALEDQVANVDFDVIEGGVTEQGRIRLPIFGSVAPDALSSATYKDPVPVFLATEKEIPVPIRNESKGMPVEVRKVSISAGDPGLWKPGVSAAFTPFILNPGGSAGENVKIRLLPRTASALASALVPGGKDKIDDTIKVNVEYATKGRTARELAITIPVRFIPWPPFLFLVAVAGACIGTLVPPATRNRKWQDFWRALATAAIVALIVEALAMVLVANNSQFKLLGFELDPFQMLPAALMGVIVGLGGFRSLEALRRLPPLDFWKKGRTGDTND